MEYISMGQEYVLHGTEQEAQNDIDSIDEYEEYVGLTSTFATPRVVKNGVHEGKYAYPYRERHEHLHTGDVETLEPDVFTEPEEEL